MPFDLKLARTAFNYTIEPDDYSEDERNAIKEALLENDLLVVLYGPPRFFDEVSMKQLFDKVQSNRQALLSESVIEYRSNSIDSDKRHKKTGFDINDASIREATRITFTEFSLQGGLNSPEEHQKLHALKWLVVHELANNAKHLVDCFWYYPDFPDTNDYLKRILNRNLKNREKHRFDFPLWTGALYAGVACLCFALPMSWGMALLGLATLPMGGILVGNYISFIREMGLYFAGRSKLQALKDDISTFTPEIKEAYIAGFESSKSNKAYLQSFTNFKLLKPENYKAYAAGLYTGLYSLEKQTETIQQLRSSRHLQS